MSGASCPEPATFAGATAEDAALDGAAPAVTHTPTTSPMIMIPMGERDGVGLFPLGLVVGPRITVAAKSRTLLVAYFRKHLNQS